ncbi:TonB-dependent receptor [Duganella sp. sic0402]|uniref:TonB-dependent receptor plug domain-containing protein n=1 Tax=Duganella sp. sic0402 TaxID=2854786 RepID=UPI001C44CC20|nr:TonB-dependent receptor plug domain-containing protein [Duganella sp. sic0402]MBV7537668.1 TonB-dependent receptor [Duganella sp. sic0402]
MKIEFEILCGLALISASAYSQEASLQSIDSTVQQKVIVNGRQSDTEASRDFAAGKLIIGRQSIVDSALQNVSELLRREPAVTIGKDGRIGLLGLPNYTQILVDGHPPAGKSALEIDLAQVERIEIIKTTTAETGPFGIAGTINIVSRRIERRSFQYANTGLNSSAGNFGFNASWGINQFSQDSPLSLNLNVSARQSNSPRSSTYVQRNGMDGILPVIEYLGQQNGQSRIELLSIAGELAYKLDAENTFSVRPDMGQVTQKEHSTDLRNSPSGQTMSIQQNGKSPFYGFSLPMTWKYDQRENGELDLKLRLSRNKLNSDSYNRLQDSFSENILRQQELGNKQAIDSFSLDYSRGTKSGHDVKLGSQITHKRLQFSRDFRLNGMTDTSLSVLGVNSNLSENNYRLFAQDAWRINKLFAINLGVSAEEQRFNIREGSITQEVSYRLWSPSLHVSKKMEHDTKQQFRASLARNYKAPDSSQLLLQPSVNSYAPCSPLVGCAMNTVDTADRMGNPMLQAERATALNLSYELGISKDSQITFEFYARDIKGKVGNELVLTNVAWSVQPRYVLRPTNLGNAQLRGLNLELRLIASDVWKTAPKIEVRGSLGWAHSELSDIPVPDNRMEGQNPWRAKLGLTYAMKDWPVKLDVDANYLPGNWYRNQVTQRTYESHSAKLSANLNWTVNPKNRWIVSLDNLLPHQGEIINETHVRNNIFETTTKKASYARISVRAELKF